MWRRLRIILVILPIYFGCGQTASTTTESANTLTNLAGTWKTSCQGPVSSAYAMDQVVVSSSDMTQTLMGYSNSTCSTLSTTMVIAFTVTVGSTSTSSGPTQNATKLNATLVSIKATPNTASAATNWNTATYCGFSNWANGVTKDITGNTTCSMKSAGAINYQMFRITSSSGTNNNLVFGDFPSLSIFDFYDSWNSNDNAQPVFFSTTYTKQ